MLNRTALHRTAHHRTAHHCTAHHRTASFGTVVAFVALGTLAAAIGCQSPGADNGFRLPGPPTPALTPGGNTPAGPGVTATSAVETQAGGITQPGGTPQVNASQREIAQVGFVDRRRAAASGSCGSCQGCARGDQCGQCQTVLPPYPVMAMGRPVDPQEFLCNGGDVPPEARVLRDDSISGLEPQDAIVHYTTEAGKIEIVPSNRVCVYSPRFGAVRQVSGAVAGEKAIGLRGTYQPVGPTGIALNQPSLIVEDILELRHADVSRRIDAMRDRNRGVPVEGIVHLQVAEDALQILATLDFLALNRLDESQIAILQQGAVAAQSWMIRDAVEVVVESVQPPVLTRDARVEALVEYDFPDAGRLQILKVADRDHAHQGEEVAFAIHVRNVGDSPVNHVEIADNLVARLEYVEDSQTCDREATFETKANSAGSVRIKWLLKEPLAVGETALIEFKCRVR